MALVLYYTPSSLLQIIYAMRGITCDTKHTESAIINTRERWSKQDLTSDSKAKGQKNLRQRIWAR